MKQTRPCSSGPSPQDCIMSDWREWSTCSSDCGEGQYSRFRRVVREASRGGHPCDGVIHQTETCQLRPCDSRDCEVSEWSEWSTSNPLEGHQLHTRQWFRERRVLVPPGPGGRQCPTSLSETVPRDRQPQQCVLSEWSLWSHCDRTCGGGQMMRERSLQEPGHQDGFCGHHLLRMVSDCNTGSCSPMQTSDCQWSQWGEWSECSARCGEGSKQRERRILSEALAGGTACEGPLKELSVCQLSQCTLVDCRWADWGAWSDCSCECGGGTKRRSRGVMEAPRNGGKECEPQDMEQAFPCNTQPCGSGCVDGQWGAWSSWTSCSATCSSSYQSRSRNLEIQPSSCGKAAAGPRDEYQVCSNLQPCIQDTDCQLHDWGEWSHCSCHCFGIRERNRFISHFATGKGNPCARAALKVIEPCNPGPIRPFDPDALDSLPLQLQMPPTDCQEKPPVDCELHDWTEWTRCSRTCGGGQRERSRTVRTAPKHGGQPCKSDLTTVEPCNLDPCHQVHCEDCRWGQWSDWGGCSKCGGQKYRHRSIIQMANHCGKPCDVRAAKETTNCTSECKTPLYCAWTEWSGATSCAPCGPATTMRNRALGFSASDPGPGEWFFRVTGESECAGTQLNVSLCPSAGASCEHCVPQHCHFSEWGDWREPTCVGLCERERTIATINNECGNPCDGPMLMTKSCPVECTQPKDCAFSAWTEWSQCPVFASQSQRTRSRTIAQQPENEGRPCVGPLEETVACEYNHLKVDCAFSPWDPWSSCSRTCGSGGWKERTRNIADAAAGGGLQCKGGLTELVACDGAKVCDGYEKVDCQFAAWGSWSAPDTSNQRKRERKIVQMALHGGDACEGSLEEVESLPPVTSDCLVSEWSEWDNCDRGCGGGQSTRHREVRRFPQAGGASCPTDLKVTRSCNTQSCDAQDCTVSQWGEWGPCSSSCGAGQQSRSRHIVSLRTLDGIGCKKGLGMTQQCEGEHYCGKLDCEWGEWSDWSGCTCSCDGGQQTRTRHIARAPRNGGLPCQEGDKEQIAPCNTQPCGQSDCRDGQWAEWTSWAPCSVTCGGGVRFRRRRIGIMANDCGREPLGKNREIAFCDVGVHCSRPVDCELSEWSSWSACSSSCDGIRHRSRVVRVYGRADGRWCKGGLRETAPCHPTFGSSLPQGCGPGRAQDCLFGPWEAWKECSATCDGGEHARSREIVQHAKNGGLPCEGDLKQISECARHECGGPAPKDCIFGDWEDWGACGKCSGQRKRFRSIRQYPTSGGKECELTDTEEAGKCPRSCHTQHFCGWATWGIWGSCSASCGQGYRQRRRHLQLSDNPDALLIGRDMIQEYDDLVQRTEDALHALNLAVQHGPFCNSGAPLQQLPDGWEAVESDCASERRSNALAALETVCNPRVRLFKRDVADGARGCYFSHLAVYEEVTSEGMPWAVIFEDNVLVLSASDLKTMLDTLDEWASATSWKILHLSLVHSAASLKLRKEAQKDAPNLGVPPGVVRVERTAPDWYGPVKIERAPGLGTTAYVISSEAAKDVLKRHAETGYRQPIDDLLAELFGASGTFAAYPAPVHRGRVVSLINPDQELFRAVMYDPRVFKNVEWTLVQTGLSSSQLVWVFLAAMAAWTVGVSIPAFSALLR
ncbi:adt-1 [Symbiodinium sp. CCMP2456]|nr:adt-1 [Symbiodinium sp. CCMP2456]